MIRQCANKKSVKHPDVRCTLKATHGEFCFRHYKNPKRFGEVGLAQERKYSKRDELAAKKIGLFWKWWGALLRVRRHGLGLFNRSVSQNDTEVTTMDDVTAIPNMYYFSYRDCDGKLWSFDIRSLIGIVSVSGATLENPYTREKFGEGTMKRFYALADWLRARKYATQFAGDTEMNETQLWNQRVLDVFLKMDKLGFTTNLDWFHELRRNQLIRFYAELYYLWKYLPLKKEARAEIVGTDIFKGTPESIIGKGHDIRWWQEEAIRVIEAFCSEGKDTTAKSSGALYVIRCLCVVSDKYAEAYSWVIS